MKNKVALATLAMLPLSVATVSAMEQDGVVTATSLNVRSGPSTKYNVLTTVKKNEKLTILDSSNGWYNVRLSSGKEGWASANYITKSTQSTENTSSLNQSKVTADALNMRSGAGTSYRVITVLKKNEIVEVVSESKGWTKIKYDGRLGYVSSKYIESVKTDNSSSNSTTITKTETSKLVTADVLNVRSGPGTKYSVLGKLKRNQEVTVIENSNGWSKINYNNKEAYVSSDYLKDVNNTTETTTEKNDTITETPDTVVSDVTTSQTNKNVNYTSLSYTLDDHINKQIERVSVGGNVIDSTKPRAVSTMANARAYIAADSSDIEYFLNPENFTSTSRGMMQFLRIDKYTEGISVDKLNNYLNKLGSSNVFYNKAQAFIDSAKKYDLDLSYLVSHAMWETGYGSSTLAKGQTITSFNGQKLESPVTVYNFYGIGAIDKNANVSGAEAAYSNGWTSVESAIDGAANWIASNYVKSSKYNQNTIYKMKWNYDYTWHQYATDVNWANGMSKIMEEVANLYDDINKLTYEVPKYK